MVRSVLLCDRTADAQALHAEVSDATDVLVDVVTDARRALEFAARTRPDVVVCRLPRGDFPDVELLTRLRASSPTSCIVVRVDPDDATLASASLAAGAHAVVSTLDERDVLLDAIRSVTPGVVVITELVARHLSTALAIATDESGRLARELDELRSDVAHGSSAKADFLSNISHELRTPVTVAKGIAYVLRNPSIAVEERTEFLDQLQGSLDKLMGVRRRDHHDVGARTRRARTRSRERRPRRDRPARPRGGADVATPRCPSRPRSHPCCGPSADEGRLEGVITELLDNACRYSPEGVAVEVSARAMSEGVVVSVTDRGEGLDRTVARRSFDEPFSTGEGVLRKEKAGIGVGLHLARQLVIEHGGTLWTDPLPGGGTRVAFCIPPVDARVGARSHAGSAGAA